MKQETSDICIIGGGITGAMMAARLAETTGSSITVIEAGSTFFDLGDRFAHRQRNLDYGENAWPGDTVPDMVAEGIISRTMALGGSALHWGGTVPRFSREDFNIRTLYGIGYDWPIDWEDIEPFYCESERRMGVAGEVGSVGEDPRSEPYPMAPHPMNPNLRTYRDWAAGSGIAFWNTPSAKNTVPYDGRLVCQRCDTCIICPTGAKYSPDFTFQQLLATDAIELYDRTLVRRLEIDRSTGRVVAAIAVDRDTREEMRFEADTFVLAAGYAWTSHILLLSAAPGFEDGLANSSGLVGKHMGGHRPVSAMIEIPAKIFPGINGYNTLVTRQFMRLPENEPYVRHDLRIFESTYGRQPRMRDDDGNLLIGDAIMADWRARTERGCARVRAYYDIVPAAESELTLDTDRTNDWGDPLPRIQMHDHEDSLALRDHTHAKIHAVFDRLVEGGGGRVLTTSVGRYVDHPCGGCRMGDDPSTSVVDPTGRTWDHDNVWIAGAPTCVSPGCANGTNTFVALSLRTAAAINGETV